MSLAQVPLFITANSPQELVRNMLRNNIRGATNYKYFDIGRSGKGWIAWYYGDASRLLKQLQRAAINGVPPNS